MSDDGPPDYAYAAPEDPRFDIIRAKKSTQFSTLIKAIDSEMRSLESDRDQLKAENDRLDEKYNCALAIAERYVEFLSYEHGGTTTKLIRELKATLKDIRET